MTQLLRKVDTDKLVVVENFVPKRLRFVFGLCVLVANHLNPENKLHAIKNLIAPRAKHLNADDNWQIAFHRLYRITFDIYSDLHTSSDLPHKRRNYEQIAHIVCVFLCDTCWVDVCDVQRLYIPYKYHRGLCLDLGRYVLPVGEVGLNYLGFFLVCNCWATVDDVNQSLPRQTHKYQSIRLKSEPAIFPHLMSCVVCKRFDVRPQSVVLLFPDAFQLTVRPISCQWALELPWSLCSRPGRWVANWMWCMSAYIWYAIDEWLCSFANIN